MKKSTKIILLIIAVLVVIGIFWYAIKKHPSSVTPAEQSAAAISQTKAAAAQIKNLSQTDSDLDGISNSDEINIYHTDPNKADTDGDGLLDGDEIKIYHTNPLKWDTDGDGYSDGYKVRRGVNPLGPNSLDLIAPGKSLELPPLTAYNGVQITPSELMSAGFTGVKQLLPTAVQYYPPQYYFSVDQHVAGSLGWGAASNVITVLVLPTTDKNWVYNNGQMEIKDESGRTQINLTTSGYYISIDGPDKDKETSLANELSKLF